MSKANSPYFGRPEKVFWKSAVQSRHFCDLVDIASPIRLSLDDRVATAGSCFAQHIGRHLRASGAAYMDMEPRPQFLPQSEARRFGYGIYSCRYGNIYTARQLLQLLQESLRQRTPRDLIWMSEGRCFDALRPSVDPVGYDSPQQVVDVRKRHLEAVAAMFRALDVFVFTLGLTEAWLSRDDGTVYPTAAGTIVGEHDPQRYEFRNFRYHDVADDLQAFRTLLRSINPKARILLTVSPVPLNATASNDHVLVASTRSKAVLRAVAGDLAEDCDDVFYFPSFEIISTHPSRAMFFEPDLRNVNDAGVSLVMRHFFHAFNGLAAVSENADEIICDEAELDRMAPPVNLVSA